MQGHGVVLRYDTHGGLTNFESWTAYDAGNTGGMVTKGYVGAVFDGRYVYFVPHTSSYSDYHGRVLRYDTKAVLTASNSWAVFDAGSASELNAKGYAGGIFDGRYVYFAPCATSYGSSYHGRVLRYDTQGVFTNVSSWLVYDAGNTGGLNSKGYLGAVYDGQ